MPGEKTNVEIHLGQTLTMLDGINARARNLKPVLTGDLTNAIHAFFEDQFRTAGAAGGSPWLPLKAQTLAFKARYGRAGMGVLRFTNQMWASLTKRSHPLGRRIVTSDSVEVGTNDPKAVKHQDGLEGLPARKIAPDVVPDEYTDRWDSLLLRYVEGRDGQ